MVRVVLTTRLAPARREVSVFLEEAEEVAALAPRAAPVATAIVLEWPAQVGPVVLSRAPQGQTGAMPPVEAGTPAVVAAAAAHMVPPELGFPGWFRPAGTAATAAMVSALSAVVLGVAPVAMARL